MFLLKNNISKVLFSIIFIYILAVFSINKISFIKNLVVASSRAQLEDLYGSQEISSNLSEKIYNLSQKIGISSSLKLKKMNYKALQSLGYYNAFIANPVFLSIFPINDLYLYASQSFVEDLTEQEQDFLLGHELVHAKYKDSFYMHFFMILSVLVFAYIFYNFGYLGFRYKNFNSEILRWFLISLSFVFFCLVEELLWHRYRKALETRADCFSLAKLNTYDGAFKVMERWSKDFKMNDHHDWWGLFATHPSLAERKIYCLDLKNKNL